LNLSEIQFSKGRNLDVVCQYQAQESFNHIRGDLFRLAYALLFAELVHEVATEHDMDSHEIYELIRQALHQLEKLETLEFPEGLRHVSTELKTMAVGIAFQIGLLDASGYHPEFVHCVMCSEPLSLERPYYGFSVHMGGALCPSCQHEVAISALVKISTSTLKLLSDPWNACWQEAGPVKAQKFLEYYFSHKLEKKIKAFGFLMSQIA
jgi:DNA repair protein RecO (recombination protein O)